MQRKGSIGIDAGSTTIKIVVLSNEKNLLFHKIMTAEPIIKDQIDSIIKNELKSFNKDEYPIIATGYGKEMVLDAAHRYTEITCHIKGIFNEFGKECTIVDIGGQDSKVIKCGKDGELLDFVMNDKCSAGTGRFLENIAIRFNLEISKIGELAMSAEKEQNISSTCTVFAESEIISLLSQGVDYREILNGLHLSLVRRIKSMIKSIGIIDPIIMSGGVSLNTAIVNLLRRELNKEVIVSKNPQLTGALGAALIGLQNI